MRCLPPRCLCFYSLIFMAGSFVPVSGPTARADDGEIQLLVRADDMGVAQAVNEACIQSYREGIVRSVEVIVPGPWFLDAVRLLQENPELDVGVHLALTSEWERVKWRPLTHAPSLVDADGYFRPMTRQRPENVAADRAGVTRAFTSAAVKEAVARRKIKLVSYADIELK